MPENKDLHIQNLYFPVSHQLFEIDHGQFSSFFRNERRKFPR